MKKENITVVKIGGNIIENKTFLDEFLKDFSELKEKKVLIHGGGKTANNFAKKLGIETKMIEGRRVTTKKFIDIAIMTYGGLINKNIVSKLQQLNCNSIGLTGADANIIQSIKRPVKSIDYGYVGDIKKVNSYKLHNIIQIGLYPVFCALSFSRTYGLLNTNADTIASEVSKALTSNYNVKLIYCFEKNGVLKNIDDSNSVIKNITSKNYNELKSKNIINDGMIPKIDNCFEAIKNNVTKVIIGNHKILNNRTNIYTTISE